MHACILTLSRALQSLCIHHNGSVFRTRYRRRGFLQTCPVILPPRRARGRLATASPRERSFATTSRSLSKSLRRRWLFCLRSRSRWTCRPSKCRSSIPTMTPSTAKIITVSNHSLLLFIRYSRRSANEIYFNTSRSDDYWVWRNILADIPCGLFCFYVWFIV